MIINKEDKKILNENPKTFAIIEKHGKQYVCKILGEFEKLEDAINFQSEIVSGIITEEQASKKYFNDIHRNHLE